MDIDGSLRFAADHGNKFNGITPICIEKLIDGKWTRIGYSGGPFPDSPIITLDDWMAAAVRAKPPNEA